MILGIDPGLSRCGYGLVCHYPLAPRGKLHYVDSGVWETAHSDGETPWHRGDQLRDKICDTLDDWKEHGFLDGDSPLQVAVEAPIYAGAKGAHNTQFARGLLCAVLSDYSIYDITDINPAAVKKLAADEGNADKEAVKVAMKKKIGIIWNTRHYDESDAIAIAYAAWRQECGDATL